MFDVELDPDETIDLSARYASDARRYADALAAWVAARQEAVNGVVARCHTTPACE
jgi:hypothetical protein